MEDSQGASAKADRAGRASPEPYGLGHSATIPCAERLKLDRRIRAQRAALRDNWMVVDQRQAGHRRFTLAAIRELQRLCDLLGVPRGGDGWTYALLHRAKLAAQGIEARQRHDREAGHGPEDESPVAESDAPNA